VNTLVDDILEKLQQHALVKTTRVVNYDETSSGKLEVKIRCDLPKSHHENGNVSDSALTGNIKKDLKVVLREISDWMKEKE